MKRKSREKRRLAGALLAILLVPALTVCALAGEATLFAGTFTNRTLQAQVSAELSVRKEVRDGTGTFSGITKEMFAFVLTEWEDETFAEKKGEEKEAWVLPKEGEKCAGTATFALTLDGPGTRYFTVSEKPGDLPGIRYVQTPVRARVDVTREGTALVAKVTWLDEPVIENVYEPKACALRVEAGKKLLDERGAELPLKAGAFSFVLEDGGRTLAEAVNDASGKVAFPAVTLKKPGIYALTVREVPGKDETIVYDDTVFTLWVEVRDEGGILTAAALSEEEARKKGGLK